MNCTKLLGRFPSEFFWNFLVTSLKKISPQKNFCSYSESKFDFSLSDYARSKYLFAKDLIVKQQLKIVEAKTTLPLSGLKNCCRS